MSAGNTTTIGELKAWVNSLGDDQNDKLFAYRLAHQGEDTDGGVIVFDFAINGTIFSSEEDTYLGVDNATMEFYNSQSPTPESETPNL
jgi:hypothetical protein